MSVDPPTLRIIRLPNATLSDITPPLEALHVEEIEKAYEAYKALLELLEHLGINVNLHSE